MDIQDQSLLSGNGLFAVLMTAGILLVLVIVIVAGILRNKRKKAEAGLTPIATSTNGGSGLSTASLASDPMAANSEGDEEETLAAIMAAISIILADGNGFRLRSIRRTSRNTPAWNTSGRDEYLATRL